MEKQTYLLLHAVKNNSDIKMLIREGMSYLDIAKLTKSLIKDGLIVYDSDIVNLSIEGEKFYKKIKDNYKRRDKSQWIEREFKYQIPKLDKNVIFVPSQNELTFEVNTRRPVAGNTPPE